MSFSSRSFQEPVLGLSCVKNLGFFSDVSTFQIKKGNLGNCSNSFVKLKRILESEEYFLNFFKQ